MEITSAHIAEFIQNFKDKVRLDIPINAGHDNGMSGGELPAIGWFTDVEDRGVNAGFTHEKPTVEPNARSGSCESSPVLRRAVVSKSRRVIAERAQLPK